MLLYGWFDDKYNEYRSRIAAQELLDGLGLEESNHKDVQSKGTGKKKSKKKKAKAKKKNAPVAAETKISASAGDSPADSNAAVETTTIDDPPNNVECAEEMVTVMELSLDEIDPAVSQSIPNVDDVETENNNMQPSSENVGEVIPITDAAERELNNDVSVEQNEDVADTPEAQTPSKHCENKVQSGPTSPSPITITPEITNECEQDGATSLSSLEAVESNETQPDQSNNNEQDSSISPTRLETAGQNKILSKGDDESKGNVPTTPLRPGAIDTNACGRTCLHCGSLLTPKSTNLLERSANEVLLEAENNDPAKEEVPASLTYSFGDFETEFYFQATEVSPKPETVRTKDSVDACEAEQGCNGADAGDVATSANATNEDLVEPSEEECSDDANVDSTGDVASSVKATTKDMMDSSKEGNTGDASSSHLNDSMEPQSSMEASNVDDEMKNDEPARSEIADVVDSSPVKEEVKKQNVEATAESKAKDIGDELNRRETMVKSKVENKLDQLGRINAKSMTEHRKPETPYGFDAATAEKYLGDRFDHIFSQKFDLLPSGKRVAIVRL